MVSCLSFFCGVVSLSSVDYVYVLAGAQGKRQHKVSTRPGMLGSLGRGGKEQPDHNQGAGQIDVLEVD